VRWVVQRPDFHIFGTATEVDGAADLISDLRHQLTSHSG
jgi:hypothetical protein